MTKVFLLVAGVFLIPVALSYGVDPAVMLPKTMNLKVEGTDLTHISILTLSPRQISAR